MFESVKKKEENDSFIIIMICFFFWTSEHARTFENQKSVPVWRRY